MKKSKDEPIVAKIISSNVNSEEDDFILNTTMDKIESAFNLKLTDHMKQFLLLF